MQSAQPELVRTGVDKLVEFLKGKAPIEISVAAEKLNVAPHVVQSWTDFLVEEKIIGLDYKFTKPLIYLIEKNKGEKSISGFNSIKENFKKNAQSENMSEQRTEYLWQYQIIQALNKKKDFFYEEAKKRNFQDIDSLWEEYNKKATSG